MPENSKPAGRWAARLRGIAGGVVSLAVFIGLWEAAVVAFKVPLYVVPPPLDVWNSLFAGLMMNPTDRGSDLYQLADTLEATAFGFVIGGIVGIVLAALMAEFRVVQKVIFPYVAGFQSIPKVAIAPLFIIWFGYGIEPKVAMAATLAFFPVLLNSLEGFVGVEREQLELMASLNAGRWQTFFRIKLPGGMPFIFTGLNLGIVYAFLGAIVAEFIGAQRGMGVLILQAQSNSDTAGVFAILVLLAVAGYVLIAIVRALQRRFVFWEDSSSSNAAP